MGVILLVAGSGVVSFAAPSVAVTPEIDPAMGANALALVAGALMIIRSRRR
jgi:hypothetical protein